MKTNGWKLYRLVSASEKQSPNWANYIATSRDKRYHISYSLRDGRFCFGVNNCRLDSCPDGEAIRAAIWADVTRNDGSES